MKKLAIFDVCGTVINGNSTELYIDFLIKNKIPLNNAFIRKPFIKKILQLVNLYCTEIFKFDFLRSLTVNLFKGICEKDVRSLDEKFKKIYLSKVFPYFLNLLEVDNVDKLFLSGSIEPPIDILSKVFDIPYFSSKLEKKEGIYTGKLEIELLGKKEEILERIAFVKNYSEVSLYTDNENDVSLIDFLLKIGILKKVFIIKQNNLLYWEKYFRNKKIEYEYLS